MLVDVRVVMGECVVGFVTGVCSMDVSRCECSDGGSVWWVL